ncbi:hypothetical protein BHE74_00002901 [Ensete ventricosum]|nr:hypothetical protein BHE74_00002901 [Ensete ventricosum]
MISFAVSVEKSAFVTLIGFSADIGVILGDTKENCSSRTLVIIGLGCTLHLYNFSDTVVCINFRVQLVLFWQISQITYSVPFSVTAELTAGSGGGQGQFALACYYLFTYVTSLLIDMYFVGLATGVLNLAIVIPQVSLFFCLFASF